ncbi:hypothetical protein E4U13_006326 [Claviceps humidiphila]|uniref:Heterokaryon incompatibility domain-containing protein n=1 Tax=Claviceps humidiphila TaxID=1294629 RepID=A0A9P7PZB4_9HYPO|nr:hypothetical protein E4U13_006326 [Claviceps humidiphila]
MAVIRIPSASTSAAEPYASRPLHKTTDGIRVVTIETDLDSHGRIVCHLHATTFAQRPRYETLSYRWGDESLTKTIVVDDVEMCVTTNLWDALQYFRENPRNMPIWIDALSINQRDVPERSSQLRIMPHIYTRASSTLVWLGRRYIGLFDEKSAAASGAIAPGGGVYLRDEAESSQVDVKVEAEAKTNAEAEAQAPPTKPDPHTKDPLADIKDQIMTDGYWDRVWILQEIGKSRHIQLCFGKQPTRWDTFITWIRTHASSLDHTTGPLKVDHLRQDKYDGSCSLRSLLTNHASALAKDPRDKIYGLVGLSTDGRGFPMDYNKTLLEVWSDTIHFMSRHELLPRECDQRMHFCQLVRELLGGENALGSVSGVVCFEHAPGEESFLDERPKRKNHATEARGTCDEMALSELSFWAEVYGVIVSLGPWTSELLSSLEMTDMWEEELQRLYRGDLDRAYFENDNLLRAILESGASAVEVGAAAATAAAGGGGGGGEVKRNGVGDGTGKIVGMTRFQHYKIEFHGPEFFSDYWNFRHKNREVAPGLEAAWVYELPSSSHGDGDGNGDGDGDGGVYDEEPRLAMLKIQRHACDYTPFKLALVSPRAQQGDLVCRLQEYPLKRVVVRPAAETQSNEVRMHVCGTAVMVRDVLGGTGETGGKMDFCGDERMEGLSKMELVMDARTLYALMFGNAGSREEMGT